MATPSPLPDAFVESETMMGHEYLLKYWKTYHENLLEDWKTDHGYLLVDLKTDHAPCPVPARGQVRRQEVAGVSVDDVVEPGRHLYIRPMMMLKRNVKYNMLNVDHSCYRLKPTSGWVQSATSLIAIEGPVTLYHDFLVTQQNYL